MEFTKEQKDKLLVMYGYERIEGYAMEYGAPESENIIVSLDEFRKFIGKEADVFYFEENNDEYGRDLDDAWECLLEQLCDKLDLEEDQLEEVFKKKLEE